MSGVRLRGLQAAAHLNGQLALCKGYDEDRGRWLVQLETGEEKAIKNDNILQMLEPGTDITLEKGAIMHVTIGRVSVLNSMEEEDKQNLFADLEHFSSAHEVRAELNCPEGWPQFSVVISGNSPDIIRGARKEIVALLNHYGLRISGASEATGGYASSAAHAAEAEAPAEEEPEEVEVEGLVMKSMGKRERPSRKK
eukprot:TRINITY_DN27984_c0_g1_i1.p1 TRINITY_DN27984_c0_g1~~TRINITY_DN27984_c0_g1_i1.p1  ORF type:complete len:216 (+),score=52.43 TRINITY_DN27984_c0_g1_i1:61-648(+)